MKKTKTLMLVISFLICITLVFALKVGIGDDKIGIDLIPTPPINYSELEQFFNQSDAWITNEGVMDNVPDLYPTLDLRYLELDGSNFGFASDFLSYTQPNFDFNDVKLNNTILDLTNSTHYFPALIEVEEGTLDDGDLESIKFPEDANSYNVSEDAGADPLIININFTNVDSFDSVIGRIWYEGGQGHEVQVEIKRTDTGEWKNYVEFTDTTDFVNFDFPIFDAENHIEASGNVSLRFNHADIGNPSHVFRIDFIQLVDGFTAFTSADHDSLGGRNDILTNHPNIVDVFYNKTRVDNNLSLYYLSTIIRDILAGNYTSATTYANTIVQSNLSNGFLPTATFYTNLSNYLLANGSTELTGQWNYGNENINGSGNFTTTGIVTTGSDGIKITDIDDSDYLNILATGLEGSDRTLTFSMNAENRQITFTGNPTLNNWFNQNVKTTAIPQFAGMGIGKAVEYYTLEMEGADTGAWFKRMTNNAGTGRGTFFWFWRSQGSPASPTAVIDNSQLGKIIFSGYTPEGGFGSLGAEIDVRVDGTPGNNDMPTEMVFKTSPDGSETPLTAFNIKPDQSIFLPGVYDDDIGTERDLLIQADGQIGYDSSSIRYKENVKNFTQSDIDKIIQLRPVTYNKIGSEDNEFGFIAEEVNELFPEFVSYKRNITYKEICDNECWLDENNKTVCNEFCSKEVDKVGLLLDELGKPIPETVNYRKMSVLAIELAQKTKQENQMLNQTIQDLIKRIEVLEKRE